MLQTRLDIVQGPSVPRPAGPAQGASSLPVPPSLTFFKATNSFSAQGLRDNSSSYLVEWVGKNVSGSLWGLEGALVSGLREGTFGGTNPPLTDWMP